MWKDEPESALAFLDRIIEERASDINAEWARFLKHASRGEQGAALTALSEDIKSYFWHDPEAQWCATSTYALMGEKEEALKWLEHIMDRGWINYPLLSRDDPLLENIRGEERFKTLMKRIKREWEDFGSRRGVRPGRA
jgi:non-specific serine/threonine protein kinase